MKSNVYLLSIVTLFCIAVYGCSVDEKVEDFISDTNLLKCINKKEKHYSKIEFLYCADKNILSIDGISKLTKLNYLMLNKNNISDISELSKLKNLEQLFMDSTNITDVSSLSNLGKLKFLILGSNHISDISPLVNLKNMDKGIGALQLQQNKILCSDIDFLYKALNLEDAKHSKVGCVMLKKTLHQNNSYTTTPSNIKAKKRVFTCKFHCVGQWDSWRGGEQSVKSYGHYSSEAEDWVKNNYKSQCANNFPFYKGGGGSASVGKVRCY